MYQLNRQYLLFIGKRGSGEGVELSNFDISFKVSKNSDNKKKPNKAKVTIQNLSEEYQKYVEEPFVEVSLSVGYAGIGLKTLFVGQVTLASTKKDGPDIHTTLEVDTLYTTMNHKIITKTVPPGQRVETVIDAIAREIPEVTRTVFSGKNIKKSFVDGYPLTSSPRQALNELSDSFELEWQIDDTTLFISDRGDSYMTDNSKAFLISEQTGLIDRPYFDTIEKQRAKKDQVKKGRKGLELSILLNPAITAGSIVRIEYGHLTGYYKVENLVHEGATDQDKWITKLQCGTILQEK